MSTPLITVLITTYNYGQFVEQAIDSVLSQVYQSDRVELVVVDDGSTDDTSERLKKYGSCVEYFRKANGGQASALNFGFARAHGEIIVLLDADDFFLPGKLCRIGEAFRQNAELGMTYNRVREWREDANTYTELAFVPVSGDIRSQPDLYLRYVPYPTSAIAFRQSCLKRFLPIPEQIRMLADGFPVALMPFVAPILAIPEFLTMYRVHGSNAFYAEERQMPLAAKRSRLEKWQVLIPLMFEWVEKHGFDRRQRAVRFFFDRWRLFEESERFAFEPPGRVEFFRHLLAYIRCYGGEMSAKLRLINRVNAFVALVVGYKHFHLLDRWRGKAVRLLASRRLGPTGH